MSENLFKRYQNDIKAARERVISGSQIIKTASGPIEYATWGDGDYPVLVSHGAGGGWDQGIITASMYLDEDFRVIAPSRFGYLRTPFPADPSPAAQADAFAALLVALGISQTAVLASSGGGPSALQFALRHPERCSALVMVDAVSQEIPPRPRNVEMGNKLVYRSDFINWLLSEYFEEKILTLLGATPEMRARQTPEEKELLSAILDTMHPISMRSEGMFFDATARTFDFPLERIVAPTLVIHAIDDTVVPFSQGEYTARSIPNAHLLTLPDGGHLKIGHHHEMKSRIVTFIKLGQTSDFKQVNNQS